MNLIQGGLLALAGFAVVGFDFQSVSALLGEQATYARAGGYVYVVSGSVEPLSCRSLRTASSVKWVGAAAYHPPILIQLQPNRPLPVIGVAGESVSIWAAHAVPTTSWAVGSVLRQDLSAAAVERLTISPSFATKIDIAISSDRHPQTARALIAPRPWAGRFDECWIEFAPVEPQLAVGIVALVDAGPEPDVRVLADRSPGTVAPEVSFARRFTQWGWLAGAVLTAGLLLISELARRSEIALYLVLGWQRSELTLQRLLEFLAIQLPSRLLVGGIGVGAGIVLNQASGFELAVVLNNLALLTGAEIAGAALVMTVTVPRDLVSTLRGG